MPDSNCDELEDEPDSNCQHRQEGDEDDGEGDEDEDANRLSGKRKERGDDDSYGDDQGVGGGGSSSRRRDDDNYDSHSLRGNSQSLRDYSQSLQGGRGSGKSSNDDADRGGNSQSTQRGLGKGNSQGGRSNAANVYGYRSAVFSASKARSRSISASACTAR